MDGGMIQHPVDLRAARAKAIRDLAARSEPRPIDIEDLLGWTYRIQFADCAHVSEWDGDEPNDKSATAAFIDAMMGGGAGRGTVPCAGFRFVVARDALTVARVVARTLSTDRQRIVIAAAVKGEPPSWCDGVIPRPVLKPAFDHNGQPRWNHKERRPEPAVVWTDADGAPLPKPVRRWDYGWCQLDYQPSLEFIEMCRQIYRAWYAAMLAVLEALKGERLERWLPRPPRVHPAPWQTDLTILPTS